MHRLWVLLLLNVWLPLSRAKSVKRHLKPIEVHSDNSLNEDDHNWGGSSTHHDVGLVQLFPTLFVYENKNKHLAENQKIPDLVERVKGNGKNLYEQAKALYKRLYVDTVDHEARYKKFVDMLLQTAEESGIKLVESLKEQGLLDLFQVKKKQQKLKAAKQNSELPLNLANYKLRPEFEGFYDTI